MSKIAKNQLPVGDAKLGSYIFGFILSVGLTIIAYIAATIHATASWQLFAVIVGLAVIQLIVQLIFFLHLGKESKPRWNLMVFLFMAIIVFIVVAGSLWIMHNLDYGHESAIDANNYLLQDEGIHH